MGIDRSQCVTGVASLILLEEGGPVLLELGPRGDNLWRMKTWMDLGTRGGGVIYKKKVVDVSQKEISSC